MKLFRQILFWSHLAAGLIAGLFIGVMCFTGTVIAFEDEIVAWAERDARQVVPPAETTRLTFTDLQRKLREAQPEFRSTSVTLQKDPTAAINYSAGREGGFYVNPYTGEVRSPASTKVHDFMHVMIDWHRFLGREGEQRPLGKLINGICNIAFFALAVTGLYLWWPRTFNWRGVKAIALFNWKLSGKARDFNWHNAIGLWSAPILIVLTLTAVPISFRWGSNLIYQLVGEEPPAQQGPAGTTAPTIEIKRPSPESKPLGYDVIVPAIQKDFSQWEQIVLRSGGAQRGGQRPAGMANPAAPRTESTAAMTSERATPPSPESTPGKIENRESRIANPAGRTGPQPLTVTIRESGSWPRTATTTLTLNPFTGEILKREGFSDFSTGRQIRTWTRFLHTGQALGWPGQLIAGLACLGGCFLVYTGFALSWRRFFGKKLSAAGSVATS